MSLQSRDWAPPLPFLTRAPQGGGERKTAAYTFVLVFIFLKKPLKFLEFKFKEKQTLDLCCWFFFFDIYFTEAKSLSLVYKTKS